jgi:hypothetical protein
MQLNDVSKYLLKYFQTKSCVNPTTYSPALFDWLKNEIDLSNKYLESNSIIENISVTVEQIHEESDIKKPVKDHVPKIFWVRIQEYSKNIIKFETVLREKVVELIFVVEEKQVKRNLQKYFEYAKRALVWLTMALSYVTKECSSLEKITVFFYFNPFMKLLPENEKETLGESHANTAYTYACPKDVSEIVVFRKEDWFKTFIHETFHNLGFDFSANPATALINERILKTFHIKSEVRLYEAYTEFWATVINVAFCAYQSQKRTSYKDECVYLLNMEKEFSLFQLVKTLDHFHLRYKDLLEKGKALEFYKEQTSVLAYFIIKTILLQNFHEFISWCQTHNGNPIFQFRSAEKTQISFADFIIKASKSQMFIKSLQCSESFYFDKKRENKHPFIMQSLKMVICEMG